MTLLDDLDEELAEIASPSEEVLIPEVMDGPRGLTKKEKLERDLRTIEDNILKKNMSIIDDVGYFRDIDPESSVIPLEWIEELGQKRAESRMRLARAAWLNAKEAPVGIAVAKSVMTGIIKARSSEKSAPVSLNMAVAVHMSLPSLEIVEVEE